MKPDWESYLKNCIMHAVNTSSSVDGKAINPNAKVYIENTIIDKFRQFMKENYPQEQIQEQIKL